MKTPEEIADEIVNVASEAAYGDCPKRHMDATDEHCPGCLRSMIAAAIREVEIRGAEAERERVCAILNAERERCLRMRDEEWSRAPTPKSDDDMKTRAMWTVRAGGMTEIAKIVAAISAERSAGLSDGGKDRKATGELSDAPKPAPACARCGGSGRDSRAECRPVFDAASSRWVPEVIPCPECRGKP